MAHEPRLAALPRPSGKAEDNNSVGALPRQSDGANDAKSKNSIHPRRDYDLLASEEPEGVDPMRVPGQR